MLKTLSLILPVLIPSWRFFKSIEPSPRVEWAVFSDSSAAPVVWREFRPRPSMVSPLQMGLRLFWNPDRNEDLFVISCAERIQQQPTAHSIDEITRRIRFDIAQMCMETPDRLFRFRLVFVHRAETGRVQEVVFLSDPVPASASGAC